MPEAGAVRGAGVERDGDAALSAARVPRDGAERRDSEHGPLIPLFKPFIAPDAHVWVQDVLTYGEDGSLYCGEGPRVKQFEQEFSALVGSAQPTLLLNSCTSAITMALYLCGVGPGKAVVTTPQTCTATNTPITNLGADIVWADIDPQTGLIDPESVAHRVNEREVAAIVAVDWGGSPCDYAALKSFGIPVIEDAAHRVYALSTTHGDYVCWSHQSIKHLTCVDGGSLLVPPEQYQRAKLLRWYGLDRDSGADFRCSQSITEAGFKWQSNDVLASIGLANLRYTRDIVKQHRYNALRLGWDRWPSDHWFFAHRTTNVPGFIEHMKQAGIAASPVHRRNDEHPCWAKYRRELPGVDEFAAHAVGLPCGWWLDDNDLGRVIEAVNAW